jgi:agmatine/peptidylarginine deiminase
MTTVLPAEWAPQSAVLLTWPRPEGDFSKWFDAVDRNFVALAAAISHFQTILVSHATAPEKLRERLIRAGVPAERVRAYKVPSNDVWARDHGPITVLREKKLVHLDFRFNGWGGTR